MKAKLLSQAHQERLALQENIPLSTPLVVYLEASGHCNLKCAFCPHGGPDVKALKKDFMSIEIFERVIDSLAVFPDKIKLLRFCGNGDSLMNKDIVRMLQYAQERKIAERTELITNGILLNADLIKNMPRFLDRIICSIEGLCSEDYRRICGTDINFQNLLNNLSALYARKGRCAIHIKIHNEAVLPESKKTAFFDMFGDICDEIYIENLVPMWPQLGSAYFTNEFRFRKDKKVAKRRICAQIFKSIQVQADGEVLPCCVDWRRVNVLGDINKNSLLEIWHGQRLRRLQIEHLAGNKGKVEPCKDCSMNDYCEFDNIDRYAKACRQRLHR